MPVPRLSAVVLTSTLTVLSALGARALDRSSANSVWVAESGGAIQLASSDGSIRIEISGFANVRAATVDVRREVVWLLGDGELAAFELNGAPRFSLPLNVPRSVHADLAIVPSTGAVWVSAERDLVSVGPDGQVLGSFDQQAKAVAVAVHEEGSLLWVGTESFAEARDLVTGAPVSTIALAASDRLGDLRIAPESGRVWLAAGDRALLYESTGELVLERQFPGLRRIAPGPGGEAWLASAKSIARLDASGALGPAFEPLAGKGTIEHLVVSGEGTVWVANQTTIARLPKDGSPSDRISFRPPARIWDVATNTDWLAPSLGIGATAEGACLGDNTPSVDLTFTDSGWGVDPASLQLFIDGLAVASSCTTAPESATCQVLDPVADGERLLGATVSDYAGNETQAMGRSVVIDTVAPEIALAHPTDGAVGEEPEITVSGAVNEAAQLTIGDVAVEVAEDLTFSHGPVTLEEGPNVLEVVAVDCAGNKGRLDVTVTFEPPSSGDLPPDPAGVAPPVDPTVPTGFDEAIRFLYEGPEPIQLDVQPGAIDPRTVAVLRGMVTEPGGEPLPGVRIEVHGGTEFGHTLSREDGRFDLAVNGGGVVTLEYSKSGYLPAHRQVETHWRDFAILEDAVLIPYDDDATPVAMGSTEVQVARGSVQTDDAGERRATVILPAGTAAELVLPDNSRQSVPALTVRATEYTVGPEGPRAMPAPLPPTSGYTYAVELSADEAVAAGASSVAFSEPVYHYVENFLGFPVGGIVPAGYYDRERAVWVPSENGRVIQVLEVLAGRAVVDVDGSGQPASAADLADLGFTDGELDRLGELYAAGQSLWRTPISHFTPWDCNWPYGPPEDAEDPPEPGAEEPDPSDDPDAEEEQNDDEPAEDEEDSPCEEGSVIECENQVVGEEIPLVGTSQSLHYRSNRVPGRRVADVVKVRLSGRSVPASLKRIELRIDIAGRRIRRTFSAAPNQTHSFVWDRKDAYGRTLQGRHPATIHVGYVYPGVYYEPAEFETAFSARSPRTTIATDRDRSEVFLWRSAARWVGSTDAMVAALGGWMLTDHHVYDLSTRGTYYGYGRTRFGVDLNSLAPFEATAAQPPAIGPLGVAVGPDGSTYYVDLLVTGFSSRFYRVWRVRPDGQLQTPALFVRPSNLNIPSRVVVAPDGDVYVSSCSGAPPLLFGEIRNLRTGEIWRSFGTGCFEGFVPAPEGGFYYGRDRLVHLRLDGTTTALFTAPGGRALGPPVLDPDGRVYVSVPSGHQVWRIDPDGSARIVAGTGVGGFGGDGGPATEATLRSPGALAIGRDGSLLIADSGNRRVRSVSPSGIIRTCAGSGSSVRATGPVPPLAAGFSSPQQLAIGPDGSVYIGDLPGQNQALRRITNPLPGFTSFGDRPVASPAGDRLFIFDHRGRHLRTLDTLTGSREQTFGYDGEGRLTSISDPFGNVTRVERNASGAPTAIIAPFGQRTELAFDADGFLASVTNPAGESYQLDYAAGGLLRSVTDPKGHSKTYRYSALGRLTVARDAAGGTKTLRRWVSAPGRYRVEVATAEGRKTSYSRQRGDGALKARTTSTAGGIAVTETEPGDGARFVHLPSGTVVTTVEGADPRFRLQAPLVESREVSTPLGLTQLMSFQRQAILSVPGDLLSLSSLRTTWTVNGRQGSRLFEAATRTLTTTSPEGRTAETVLDEHARPREVLIPGVEGQRFDYDTQGRLSRVSQGEGNAERTLLLGYDDSGRLGNLVDPLGRATQFEYDDADRVIQQIQPDGSTVELQYDANGNLTAVVPPGRPPHIFRYTPVDAVAEYDPPELDFGRPATTYAYDRDRRLKRVTRPDGEVVEIAYDTAGRPESIIHPAGTVSLAYDPDRGQLSSLSTGETAISYSYDGSLLTATAWSGPVEGTVGRAYNDNFWLRSRTVNGASVTFDYDDDGLLTRAGELAVSLAPANGRVLGTVLGAIETSFSYDSFGDVEAMIADAGGTGFYSVTFERDRLGRIAAKTEDLGGLTGRYDYHYDTVGRLERVERDGTTVEEYRYDGNGNRLTAIYPWGERHAIYDAQDRLLAYGDAAFTYSEAGDLLARTEAGATTHFDYDAFGNLRRLELSSGDVLEYVIDGRNRRVGRKINGALVQGFLYADALNPVAELDADGVMVSRFVYGTRTNVPEYMVQKGVTYRILSDHLGSVRLVVSAETGAIAQRLDYDAFGRTVLDTNPGFQPFGFAGGIYDPLTGLVRFGARDYDPQLGRWTAKEPVLFVGGDSNLYGYVFADPVNLIDPTGLAGKAGGYPTKGTALVEAFTEIVSKSPAQLQWEWGGVIYQQPDGNYNYTGPVTEEDPFTTRFPGGPSDCRDVALYHNHPPHPEAVNPEEFSPADRELAKQGLEMYLLTPSNILWKLSPTGQLSRIGRFPTGDNP